jgi:hypothetical protein
LKKLIVFAALASLAASVLVASASGNHSWGKYHWARTSNPFAIELGNNTTQPWSSMLATASSDWSQSTVLDTRVVTSNKNRVTCDATLGRVEVCNADYGNTGWLGIAQIWIYRGGSHIAQGTVKLNDYYFSGAGSSYAYNNSAEELHVICQEVGHTFGLDHQSETGESLNTCMDYYRNTSSSDTRSTHPNQGDYDELLCIYDPAYAHQLIVSAGHKCRGSGHLDSFDSAGAGFGSLPGAGPSFAHGTRIGESKYVDHLADGTVLVTWITWANR